VTHQLASSIVLVAFLTLSQFAAGAESASPPPTIESMLQDLKSRGIDVIYSSSLVPPDLAAPDGVMNSDPLISARRALAHHGLELRQIGPGRFVVATAPQPEPAAPAQDEEMREVSVYASRFAIDSGSLVGPLSMQGPEIDSIPGAHDDAMRALKALPGVATNASARPYIRGSLSEDVLVRYDGITLLDPFHLKNFQSLISAIDPAAVDGIEVFSGGFPVNYGTRSGGVMNISAPSAGAGYENRVAASLISAGVSSIGTADNLPLEWFGAIRRSTLDLFEPVRDSVGKPQFSDTLGRVRWKTDKGAWTAGWLSLDDQLALGVPGDVELAHARYRDEYFWLARDHRFDGSLKTRVAAVISAAERHRTGTVSVPGVASGLLEESREFQRFEVTNDWTYSPRQSSSYSFGGEVSLSSAEYDHARDVAFSPDIAAAFGRSPTDTVRHVVNPEVAYLSLYGAHRRKWANFEAEFGLRLDAQDYEGFGEHAQLSPRLNLRYDLSDRTRFYASAGRFTQAQHVEEWRVEEGQLRSDSAQASFHSILGMAHESPADVKWSLEAYSKRWTRVAPYFDNLLNPLSLIPELAPDRIRVVPTASEASGLEFNIRTPLRENWSTWGSLSWSKVTDDFSDGDVPRSWDQPLAATAGITRRGSRLSLSALAGWHRGWPRTPYYLTSPIGTAPGTIVLEGRNSGRWSNYFTFDLRGSWHWLVRGGELTSMLEITNSTNRANPCCASIDGASAGQPVVSTDDWLPLIANLGFVYRWRRE
jgi:outer membrane receptor protein involved in Fe transport